MDLIGRLIGIKMDDDIEFNLGHKVVVIILIVIMVVSITYFATKSTIEKQIEENVFERIGLAFQQCEKTCGFNKPAFTSVDGKTLDCICLEFTDGNSTDNFLQG